MKIARKMLLNHVIKAMEKKFYSTKIKQSIEHGAVGTMYKIVFNNSERHNAFTNDMYTQLQKALHAANIDPNTRITVLSAKGRFFSSGIDLSCFKPYLNDRTKFSIMSEEIIDTVNGLVHSFIDHEKPLVALVHAPAVGFGVTMLALMDFNIASDKATYQTPFSQLGYSPEGCSTYTFPRIMGHLKAAEMLILGKTVNSNYAYEAGLVSQVVSDTDFETQAEKFLSKLSALPTETLRINKKLLRHWDKDKMHKVNDYECALEKKRWVSDESIAAVRSFLTKKQ